MELVSVVIPCYNQGKYIEECIESVKNQTYKNIEIVIVNDGSTDDETNFTLKKIQQKNTCKIINIKNGGLANARNIGIKNSSGRYILPLDSDDKIGENYVEKCVDALEKGKGDIIYCLCRRFGETNKLLYLKEFSIKTILQTNVVFCSAMFKREDYNKTNGYNSNMVYGFEDWDFWLSMIENNKTFYRINKVMFFYRIKANSMYSNLQGKKENYNKSVLQIQQNHLELYSKYKDILNKESKGLGLIKRKVETIFEIGKMILLAYI
ncbi:MAG: glycosyltransferase family 2 protein [Clostridium sp.]|nr:glycosyltransferase family 2 protein [Clostridium sp.]